jgi:hypothetical protein
MFPIIIGTFKDINKTIKHIWNHYLFSVMKHRDRSTELPIHIAAGQYPAANLLDMIVHVSLMRYAVEKYWVLQAYHKQGAA